MIYDVCMIYDLVFLEDMLFAYVLDIILDMTYGTYIPVLVFLATSISIALKFSSIPRFSSPYTLFWLN